MMKRIIAALSLLVAASAIGQSVERDGAQHVSLDWRGWADGKAVSIFVAEQPGARKRQLLVRGDKDGQEQVSLAYSGRPYFWLQPKGGKGRWLAERQLPLEGGRNFRDLGGYRSIDGKYVRWGLLYRSASMSGLTPSDYAYLGRLGIRSVCDFRSTQERASEPNAWVAEAKINYWTRDYALAGGGLDALLKGGLANLTVEQVRGSMLQTYRELPDTQQLAYAETFAPIVEGRVPLAFNCSAGKDRTGLAAALILSALGVPYETVKADFLLSNRYLDAAAIKGDKTLSLIMTHLPPEVAAPLLGVEPAYLDAAFDEIRRKHGSVGNYLADALGIGKKQIKILKKRLLE
jgi:protein-tyrosine phosphatase